VERVEEEREGSQKIGGEEIERTFNVEFAKNAESAEKRTEEKESTQRRQMKSTEGAEKREVRR